MLTPAKLYNSTVADERHRHRFEVKTEIVDTLREAGMTFVGQDAEKTRMEIMEVAGAYGLRMCYVVLMRCRSLIVLMACHVRV